MLAFEVQVNGNREAIAGHEEIVHIFANLTYTKTRKPVLSIAGNVHDQPGKTKHVGWLQCDLDINDEIAIRIVDTGDCDLPVEEIPHGYKRDLSGDLKLVCSFCARSEDEVEKLIKSGSSQICDRCIRTCAEALQCNT